MGRKGAVRETGTKREMKMTRKKRRMRKE